MGEAMKLRLRLKLFLRKHLVLREFCKSCGRRVDQIWRADDCLWEAVTRDAGADRCISCFDSEAEARGICVRWVAVADGGWPRSSRRIPDPPPRPHPLSDPCLTDHERAEIVREHKRGTS